MGDVDGDGLPDWWEYLYSQTSTGLLAGVDRDGDGMTELQESIAGTDPMDRESFFGLTLPGIAEVGRRIVWSSVSGKSYRVLRSTNLWQGFTWTQTGFQAISPLMVHTDQTAVGSGPWFYRIEVE